MGGCCEKFSEEVTSRSFSASATWTDRTMYVDYSAFSRAIDMVKYNIYQTSYQAAWLEAEPMLNETVCLNGTMDYALRARLKKLMKKGCPDVIMARLTGKLFRLNSFLSAEKFAAIRSSFDRKVTEQCLFGRQSLSNLFLNPAGCDKANMICQMVQREVPDLVCCRALPRLVQVLLWFQSKGNVLQISLCLIKESAQFDSSLTSYLFLSDFSHSLHYSRLWKLCLSHDSANRNYYEANKEVVQEVIKDMMDNIMLLYVKPERFCHVLGMYLACGMKGVMKLACVYIGKIAEARAIPIFGTTEECLFQLQHFCTFQIKFADALEKALTIKLRKQEPSLSESIELLSTEKSEQLTKISTHFEAADELDKFLTESLFLKAVEVVYSSENDGISIESLLSGWQLCPGPHLFLIFSKPPYVFGAYFDRSLLELSSQLHTNSALLQLDPIWKVYRHVPGMPLTVKINALEIDIAEGALTLEVPLTDGSSVENKVFNNPGLYKKKNFDVFYIEIWRLAPTETRST